MIDITLHKLKYRNPDRRKRPTPRKGVNDPEGGTWVFNAGRFKSTSSNAGKIDKKALSLRPRRRAYGPF